MRRKHIPQRTCIICRQACAKRELIRIVRSPNGVVEIDETGRKAGRGAYLCHQEACWEKALQGKQLEHALKTAISSEEIEALKEFAARVIAAGHGSDDLYNRGQSKSSEFDEL